MDKNEHNLSGSVHKMSIMIYKPLPQIHTGSVFFIGLIF